MKKLKLLPTPRSLTLDEISQRFSSDEKARQYFEAVRWENGRFCPHCGNAEEARIYSIKANPKAKIRAGLYSCAECRRQFTVTVGTIFEDSHIPLRKWLVAWYMLCASKKGISALQIKRMLGLGSYRTAWFMMHRIRYALQQPEFKDKLRGTVEADETYIGGRRSHKAPGGSHKNKMPVVSLVERGGKVRSFAVSRVTAENLREILPSHVELSARLMTDEHPGYKKVGKKFSKHGTVFHTLGEYSKRGGVHTNTVEGYFGNLKRGLNGVYHHVGRAYLPLYLAEFDFRYNERKTTDGARTNEGVRMVSGKRLTLEAPRGKA